VTEVTCEEDVNTPVSWCCVDCGTNTAPGYPTSAEVWAAYSDPNRDPEIVCEIRIDDQCEIYTVRSAIWAKAGMEPFGGCLCVGCIEKRLGRRLKPKDFDRSHPFNALPGTARLLKRRK
jgi:hypothetical protein